MVERRELLRQAGALGTVFATSGCTDVQDGPQSGGVIDPEEFDGRTLYWYLMERWMGREKNADWATWFGTGAYPGTGDPAVGKLQYSRPGAAWDATMARGVWGPWSNRTIRLGELQYGLYEDIESSADELVITLRSDARWSNGDPVVGRDIVPLTMAARLMSRRSFEKVSSEGPGTPHEAITDVEWSDRTATFVSSGDWFDAFLDQELWGIATRQITGRSAGDGGRGGVMQHTRMTPYDQWFDRLVTLWESVRHGSGDAWDDQLHVPGELAAALPEPPGASWYEYFHRPENCLVTGAFKPTRIDPTLIVLQRNPEFYGAEQVNVDTVLFPLLQDMEFHWGALLAGRRDYLRRQIPPETVNEAPENITQRLVPAPAGMALAFAHQTSPFDTREVRQAINYAIEPSKIAENANTTRHEPVTVPGGHAFRAETVLEPSYIEGTLTEYPHDLERASERMRAAGYQRDDDSWVDDGGTPVEIPMMSRGPGDHAAVTVYQQLSDFGLQTEGVKSGPGSGDGPRQAAWSIGVGVGYVLGAVGELYRWFVETESRARSMGMFPAEQIDAAEYHPRSGKLIGGVDAFTIDAPPIGEPDGPLETWEVVRLATECITAPTESIYKDRMRTLAWLYNWHLPVLPLTNAYHQHFVNTAEWEWGQWPDQTTGIGVDRLQPEDLLGLGGIRSKNPPT